MVDGQKFQNKPPPKEDWINIAQESYHKVGEKAMQASDWLKDKWKSSKIEQKVNNKIR